MEFKINPDLIAFTEELAFVASGNTLYCIGCDGLRWKKCFITTFYKDPYSDVKITALDAKKGYVAAGTNFMDGKLYLMTSEGNKIWEHQFATVVSLGWRPEDVTSVSIGDGFIAVSTQFMHDYVYAYTFRRKRLFSHRFNRDVLKVFAGSRITVLTDNSFSVFSKQGKLIYSRECRVSDVCEFQDKIVVCSKQTDFSNGVLTVPCEFAKTCGNGMNLCLMSGKTVRILDENLNEVWKAKFNDTVKYVFYREDEIFVATNKEVFRVVDGEAKLLTKTRGKIVGICSFGIFCYDGTLKIVPL